MKVEFFDRKSDQVIIDKIKDSVNNVIDRRDFILGKEVEELEKKIADYCGCRFAIAVSSGTDALLLALMAEGVQTDYSVIVPNYSFFATVEVVKRLDAKVEFIDVDYIYNMSMKRLHEHSPSSFEKVIIPVHLFGRCAEMSDILSYARKYNLVVIEDAAQALGSTYMINGRRFRAGSMGDYGCFSFFPTKNLGGYGDGGMIVTNDILRAEKVRELRTHGIRAGKYVHNIGGNFRMDTIQAAILLEKFKMLDQWIMDRRRVAQTYESMFRDSFNHLDANITLPPISDGHTFNQYVIRLSSLHMRADLKEHLTKNGVGTKIYYPVALDKHPVCGMTDRTKNIASGLAETTLALPMRPSLSEDDIRYVVSTIVDFYIRKGSS